MRNIGLGYSLALGGILVGLLLRAGPTLANDEVIALSGQPAFEAKWGGFYAGGQVGSSWTKYNWQYTNPNYFNTLGPIVLGTTFDQYASGMIGGIFAGYNYQTGPWVFGIEASVTGGDFRQQKPSPYFPAIDTQVSNIDWIGTATAHAGIAWNRWFVFAKGGLAGAQVALSLSDPTGPAFANLSTWAPGWTIGAGAEFMVFDGVSLGFAYNYVGLNIGNSSVSCPLCGTGVGFGTPLVDGQIEVQSVMARLTFHFDP